MKKILLFLFVLNTLSVFSQSISVEAHQTEVNPTCCMTLLDDIGTDITVRNLTNSTIDIDARMLETGFYELSVYVFWAWGVDRP